MGSFLYHDRRPTEHLDQNNIPICGDGNVNTESAMHRYIHFPFMPAQFSVTCALSNAIK
jgi:hypothetical protein